MNHTIGNTAVSWLSGTFSFTQLSVYISLLLVQYLIAPRPTGRYGVIGIPASPFYSRADYASHYGTGPLARFAFCKRDDTLLEAARRLGAGQRDYLSPQAR